MVWIKIITRFVYQTIIKNRPYDMIRYKQIVMLILGKKDLYLGLPITRVQFNAKRYGERNESSEGIMGISTY